VYSKEIFQMKRFALVLALMLASVPAFAEESMECGLEAETAAFAARDCRDAWDCMPSEHCLRGKCEPKIWRCYNNFDCSIGERCLNGVCKRY
jgi:hypothetical protein